MNKESTFRQDLADRVIVMNCGRRIANFSSPHNFLFDDGTVLPTVTAETSKLMSLDFKETVVAYYDDAQLVNLEWYMSSTIKDELDDWQNLFIKKLVDVVIVPLPVMMVLKELWPAKRILLSPFRVVRIKDRINKVSFSNKFCV